MLGKIIDRPVAVTMAVLAAVVLGAVSIRLLPVSLIPDVGAPYITVQVSEASLSAREIDEGVIRPLSRQLIQVGGLEDIVSESRDGVGTVRMTFGHGADMDRVFIEVNEKIDRSMSFLPAVGRPKVFKASSTDLPAFFIDITGEGGFADLSRFVREVIVKRVEQLPEVAMADVSGTVGEEILVLPDRAKLAQLGMTQDAFEKAVRAADVRLGSLAIRDGEYRYNVRFDALAGSAENIGAIWLRCGDRLLQVKDVAEVTMRPAKRTGLVRSDGKEAVTLAVIKQSEARMSDLKKGIADLSVQFARDYPQLSFKVTRDQTRLLEYTINNLLSNILLGVLLACLVIFLFMQDFRSPALVSLTMPVALVVSMLVFRLADLSLNIISLSGLLLGVGMMTDNTIILIDNVTARWRRGDDLRTAVLQGTKEVSGPMFTSMLTTCAVFLPLVFVSGTAGALFYEEALSVTIVLLTSYLVTVTVIPVYYYRWYRGRTAFRPHALLSRISFEPTLQRWDHRMMSWWIRHRGWAWGLVAVSVAGAALCFAFMPKERLPDMTEMDAVLKIDWNDRLSVEQNERRAAALEAVAVEDVLCMTAMVGVQQFVLRHSGGQGVSEMQLYFACRDPQALASVKERLASRLSADWPSAVYAFEPAGNVFDMVFAGREAPLTVRLRPVGDPDIRLETLRPVLGGLRAALPDTDVPEAAVKTEVRFVADPERMALYGVSYAEMAAALRNALNENRLFTIMQGSRSLPVVTGTDRENLAAILRDSHLENGDMRIPLSSLMRQTYAEDLRTVTAGAEGDFYPVDLTVPPARVRRTIAEADRVVRADGNYEAGFSGAWFANRRMAGEMAGVLVLAVLLLYLIMASQFESLLQPLIILLEVIVDLFGALAVLWVFGVSVNLMSLIGLVVVSGIVINDSILKIDTVNRLRRRGYGLYRAVMTASSRRMKAILMTSLTTTLAVAPFLARGSMGADLQYPMSLVIIAGMTVGTFVSLFIVPALYYSVYHGRERHA